MRRATFRQRTAGDPAVAPVAAERPVVADREVVADRAVVADRPVAGRRGRAGGFVSDGVLALVRIIRLITAAVVLLILLGIAFVVLDANASNGIVSTVHDAASSIVGPFDNIFTNSDHKVAIAENWGLAALVYLLIGSFIASLIARAAAPRYDV